MVPLKRSDDDDFYKDIEYGDISTGSVLISDVGPELKKPRRLKPRRFPFGFAAPSVTPSVPNRHRDSRRRG